MRQLAVGIMSASSGRARLESMKEAALSCKAQGTASRQSRMQAVAGITDAGITIALFCARELNGDEVKTSTLHSHDVGEPQRLVAARQHRLMEALRH